jgi:transcription elongation factor S-II
MASESVRALNEKIASDNLFKAKAVGETQVSELPSEHSEIYADPIRPRPMRSSVVDVNRGSALTTRCRREVQMSL